MTRLSMGVVTKATRQVKKKMRSGFISNILASYYLLFMMSSYFVAPPQPPQYDPITPQTRTRKVEVPHKSTKQAVKSNNSATKRQRKGGNVAAHKTVLKRGSVNRDKYERGSGSGSEGDRASEEDDDELFYQRHSDFDARSGTNADKVNRAAIRQAGSTEFASAPSVPSTGTCIHRKSKNFLSHMSTDVLISWVLFPY